MPKKITFTKYQVRRADYHWQQVGNNIFWFNAYVAARYQQVIGFVPKMSHRVLDIGCGDGVLLDLLSKENNASLYGVDLDAASIKTASSKVKGKFFQSKAESLPFKDNYFDVVLATEIIEHLSRPEKLLTEALRVLRPGGRLIMTTPVKQVRGLTDKLHVQEFSPEELKRLCLSHFVSVKIVTSHPLWLKNLYGKSLGKIGRYHLDLFRWLINGLVLLFGWNLFLVLPGKPSQQLAVCQK